MIEEQLEKQHVGRWAIVESSAGKYLLKTYHADICEGRSGAD